MAEIRASDDLLHMEAGMKRKVVVTMSIAFWVTDDDTYNTDEAWIEEVEGCDETTIVENAEEIVIINTEITERKE